MTTLTTTTLAPDLTGEHDDELCHVVCCADDDTGLCGKDLTAVRWAAPDEPATCVVCADLDEDAWPCATCPLSGNRPWPGELPLTAWTEDRP